MANSLSTILLASGTLPAHQAIRNHLIRQGYFLHSPECLSDLNILMSSHPQVDFVIFSSDLPGLEDMGPVKVIRDRYPETPILLLMNSINIETIRLANLMGCNEVIQEPVSPCDLDLLLSKYLIAPAICTNFS